MRTHFLLIALFGLISSVHAQGKDTRPMVYAAFMCNSGGCQAYGRTNITGPNSYGMTPFQSLAECQNYIRSASSGGKIGANGRINLMPGMYWECRGKHIEEWESAR